MVDVVFEVLFVESLEVLEEVVDEASIRGSRANAAMTTERMETITMEFWNFGLIWVIIDCGRDVDL